MQFICEITLKEKINWKDRVELLLHDFYLFIFSIILIFYYQNASVIEKDTSLGFYYSSYMYNLEQI